MRQSFTCILIRSLSFIQTGTSYKQEIACIACGNMAHESLTHLDEFLQYPRLEQKQVENWNFNREIIEIIYKIALLKKRFPKFNVRLSNNYKRRTWTKSYGVKILLSDELIVFWGKKSGFSERKRVGEIKDEIKVSRG